MIPYKSLSATEQLFTHSFEDRTITIAVDSLRKSLIKKRVALQPVAIEDGVAAQIVADSGIEAHRTKRLLALSEEEFAKLPPPIIIWDRDEKWVMVDGNHTYVVARYRQYKTIDCLVATRQLWAPFLVSIPDYVDKEKLLRTFSGIM